MCSASSSAFENVAWSSLFLLAPLGCIYYPLSILPEALQLLAKALPLVYIFEETRNILVNQLVNYENILLAFYLNVIFIILRGYRQHGLRRAQSI